MENVTKNVIFQNAAFNWDVKSVPTGHFVNGVWIENPDKQTLLNDVTDEPISVMSSNYHIFSNAKFMEFANAISDNFDVNIKAYGSTNGGKKVLIAFDKGEFEILGHKISNHLILASSHDGSNGITIYEKRVMHRCKNMWIRGANNAHVIVYHNRFMEANINMMIKGFEKKMVMLDKNVESEIDRITRYANVKIDQSIIKDAARYILEINEQDRDLSTTKLNKFDRMIDSLKTEMLQTGMTGFGLFNGVTHFNTHNFNANGEVVDYYSPVSTRAKYLERCEKLISQLTFTA